MDLSKHTQRPRRAYQALHTASQGAYAPVCKGMFTTPPPVNISQHFGLPNNCARIGSLLSAPAACYMHAPAPEPQGVDLRAPAEAPLGRGALCSFIASVKKNGVTKASPSGRTFFFFSHTPPPHFSWGSCGNSASVKTRDLVFAGTPQASKREIWSLRELRKRQNEGFGLCGNSASVKTRDLVFAGTPQASKREIWSLREPRKRQNERFGLCGNPASLTEFIAIYTQHLKPRIYA